VEKVKEDTAGFRKPSPYNLRENVYLFVFFVFNALVVLCKDEKHEMNYK
jgi:hypothetical protein